MTPGCAAGSGGTCGTSGTLWNPSDGAFRSENVLSSSARSKS